MRLLFLCGHVHRHQILRGPGAPPIVYAGSVERISFAETGEPKGFVLAELGGAEGPAFSFRELPVRPMVERALSLRGLDGALARARVEEAIAGTPAGAVVRLRIQEEVPDGAWPALRGRPAGGRGRAPRVARPAAKRGGGTPEPPIEALFVAASGRVMSSFTLG